MSDNTKPLMDDSGTTIGHVHELDDPPDAVYVNPDDDEGMVLAEYDDGYIAFMVGYQVDAAGPLPDHPRHVGVVAQDPDDIPEDDK